MTSNWTQGAGRYGPLFDAYRKWLETSDESAWEALVREARDPIMGALRRALAAWSRPASDLVDDLTQETFLRLCSARGAALRGLRGNSPQELVGYLSAVAHNIACDYARNRMAIKRGKWQAVASLREDLPMQSDVVAEVEKRLFYRKVQRCIESAEASARDRAIFWLYFRDGLTSRAIAEVKALGLAPKGVESAILRMLKNIRECLKGRWMPDASEERRVES